MIAVIFTAELASPDDEYEQLAAQLRDLAFTEFGCLELNSAQQGAHEITVSYWESSEQVRLWRAHPLHRRAQELGRTRWYRSYRVEVAEVQRRYGHPGE